MVKITTLPLLGKGIAIQASNRISHLFKSVPLSLIFSIDDEEHARLCSRYNPAFLFNRKMHQG